MKKLLLLNFLPTLLLIGCGDGVPKVADPHNIVVDGKPMLQTEFMNKYCAGKPANETCLIVSKAALQDSTKGKMPAGW
jgi:hypothetical protein